MPSTWTEPAVAAADTATIAMVGRARCVRIPDNWPLGANVRVLLLPTEPRPARKETPAP